MDWINCNSCCVQPAGKNDIKNFSLTSCGHIFCAACGCFAQGTLECCQLCGTRCSVIAIGDKTFVEDQNISGCFNEPEDACESLLKLLKFQKKHRTSLFRHHQRILLKYNKAKLYIKKLENKLRSTETVLRNVSQTSYNHSAETTQQAQSYTLQPRLKAMDGRKGQSPSCLSVLENASQTSFNNSAETTQQTKSYTSQPRFNAREARKEQSPSRLSELENAPQTSFNYSAETTQQTQSYTSQPRFNAREARKGQSPSCCLSALQKAPQTSYNHSAKTPQQVQSYTLHPRFKAMDGRKGQSPSCLRKPYLNESSSFSSAFLLSSFQHTSSRQESLNDYTLKMNKLQLNSFENRYKKEDTKRK